MEMEIKDEGKKLKIESGKNKKNVFSFFFSATMTSGDEDDILACSYKTVIHRPIKSVVPHPVQPLPPLPSPPAQISSPPPTPHFYLAPADNPTQMPTQSEMLPLTPSPLFQAPPTSLPVFVLPPPVNLSIHHRAHTDTDLAFYNQQPLLYPVHWYPSPTFFYPNQNNIPTNFVYGPVPPFIMHPIPQQHQQQVRSSSADCRRTATNGSEHRVIHPERVW